MAIVLIILINWFIIWNQYLCVNLYKRLEIRKKSTWLVIALFLNIPGVMRAERTCKVGSEATSGEDGEHLCQFFMDEGTSMVINFIEWCGHSCINHQSQRDLTGLFPWELGLQFPLVAGTQALMAHVCTWRVLWEFWSRLPTFSLSELVAQWSSFGYNCCQIDHIDTFWLGQHLFRNRPKSLLKILKLWCLESRLLLSRKCQFSDVLHLV